MKTPAILFTACALGYALYIGSANDPCVRIERAGDPLGAIARLYEKFDGADGGWEEFHYKAMGWAKRQFAPQAYCPKLQSMEKTWLDKTRNSLSGVSDDEVERVLGNRR